VVAFHRALVAGSYTPGFRYSIVVDDVTDRIRVNSERYSAVSNALNSLSDECKKTKEMALGLLSTDSTAPVTTASLSVEHVSIHNVLRVVVNSALEWDDRSLYFSQAAKRLSFCRNCHSSAQPATYGL